MPTQARLLFCLIVMTLISPHQARAGGIVYSSEVGPANITGESAESSRSGLNGEESSLVAVVALLGGLTLMSTTKLIDEAVQDRQVARFQARYTNSARAMNKDLKRRKGRQYKWVVSRFLELPRERRRTFRCLLREKQVELSGYLKSARSKQEAQVERLARQLIAYGELSKNQRTQCALLNKYLMGRAAFKKGLFTDSIGGVTRFINKYVGVTNSDSYTYHCLLRGRRSQVVKTLQMMDQAKTRYQALNELDRLLKDTYAEQKRGARCKER